MEAFIRTASLAVPGRGGAVERRRGAALDAAVRGAARHAEARHAALRLSGFEHIISST